MQQGPAPTQRTWPPPGALMVTGEAKEQVRHRGETVAHVAVEACGSFLPVASILFPGK